MKDIIRHHILKKIETAALAQGLHYGLERSVTVTRLLWFQSPWVGMNYDLLIFFISSF